MSYSAYWTTPERKYPNVELKFKRCWWWDDIQSALNVCWHFILFFRFFFLRFFLDQPVIEYQNAKWVSEFFQYFSFWLVDRASSPISFYFFIQNLCKLILLSFLFIFLSGVCSLSSFVWHNLCRIAIYSKCCPSDFFCGKKQQRKYLVWVNWNWLFWNLRKITSIWMTSQMKWNERKKDGRLSISRTLCAILIFYGTLEF